MKDYLEEHYKQVFDKTYESLMVDRETNPNLKLEDLERLLDSLYIRMGDDQGGRGDIMDAANSAEIAAVEIVIHDWKEEGKK
ncbi:hypothetical protein SANA_09280 [Gottschalkiaceae bacterium SANA]|jgi:hypothetical protein|nr:hypothetical protein SANA_09280 [Gottschalkiaceae bacterium SANA]